eukprot:tig00020554_g10906.t1
MLRRLGVTLLREAPRASAKPLAAAPLRARFAVLAPTAVRRETPSPPRPKRRKRPVKTLSFAANDLFRSAAEKDELPDPLAHVTGLEREEALAELVKDPRFEDIFEPIYDDRMGTEADPIVVRSTLDSRIVGCTGGAGDDAHDVMWININTGEKASCILCSQWFAVKHLDLPKLKH